MLRRTVPSGDVNLAVWQAGDPANPTVVLVHGYPDDHRLWDGVTGLLYSQFHVVAYDVRGAGASTAPPSTSGYSLDRLVDDLVAVLDATLPSGHRAHLVGHDWGSIQLWEAVMQEATDPRLAGRLASFTSISGPSLDHLAWFFRSWRQSGQLAMVAQQAVRSAYVGLLLIPALPVLAMRLLAGRDGANGLNLYRVNIPVRMRAPRPATTDVPVQLVVLTGDAFLTPNVLDGLEKWVHRLERVEVDAGHWAPRTKPESIAALVAGFVQRVEVAGE